ncbi:hypothetical protein Pmani_030883 [Petrolisthes manimaculis]|uniref:Uncharacterized protein n=1 Tax=Petrolisthes manimaculis TaxID=1843537 RepID=A0AAE1NWH7_9EUCA|nr:hypothetical protein Pmani_030883 [Petrolisthes manimaculis]
MKVLAVLLGVSLVLCVSGSQVAEEKADDTPVQAKEVKVEAEESHLEAQESRRVENKVQLQPHIEGQLGTSEPGKDSSFHLDSRSGVTTLQGAVPKHNILHNHQKLTQYSQEAAQKVHSAYTSGVVSNMYNDAPYQWAYEVMAPSTGDYQSRVEHRQPDGLVRGRYSLVDPDGSLRVVSYIAHPEDGFKATVENHPITTSNNIIQTYNDQQQLNLNQPQQQGQFNTFTPYQTQQHPQQIIQPQRLRSFTVDSQDVNEQTYQRRTRPQYILRQNHQSTINTPLQYTIDQSNPFTLQHPFFTNTDTTQYGPTYIYKPQLPAQFISPMLTTVEQQQQQQQQQQATSLTSDRINQQQQQQQQLATFTTLPIATTNVQVNQPNTVIPSHFRPAQFRIRPDLLRNAE